MSAEARLAALWTELQRLGVSSLVMGGHAVRHYGVDRSTIDFDLHVAIADPEWGALHELLLTSPLLASSREGPSWRSRAFRRFVVGVLADGEYGGALRPFLGLDDLIRSKETEREDDWRDVRLLEEIADERRLARVVDARTRALVLVNLRSQRGFERAHAAGLLADHESVVEALHAASTPITVAFLAPFCAGAVPAQTPAVEAVMAAIRHVEGGSVRHRALVEAVRRLHQRPCMGADRRDKENATR